MSATTLPRRRRLTPERLGGLIGALAASVVAVVAIGRFVATDDRPAPVAVTAAPTTLSGAITEYESRTTERPEDAAAWTTLGSLYVRQAAASGDPAFYAVASTALERADALAPEAPATLAARGGLALAIHDFATARSLSERAIETAPFRADAYAVAVDAAVELGDYDAAGNTLQRLVDLKPDSAALSRVSYFRELHGDLDGARVAMDSAEAAAVSEPSERAVIASFVGDLALATGDVSGAEAAYQRALDAAPKLLGAELGLARTEIARGDLTAASTRLEVLVARTPQPAVATLLADVRAQLDDEAGVGDAVALVRASDRLLRAAGVTVDLESAVFEADHGDADTAVELATAAYEARRTVFTADALAWSLTRVGRVTDALPYVEEALHLGTPTASLHVHAAVAFDLVGDDERARSELTTAFVQAPWFALSVRSQAVRLATELGVTVPSSWSF